MKIKIHRTIGDGCYQCVEVVAERARLALDMGLPLVSGKAPGDSQRILCDSTAALLRYGMLPNIPGLFGDKKSPADDLENALLTSRAQLEKEVLADFVGANCLVYLGKAPHSWRRIFNVFRKRKERFEGAKYFESEEEFSIGDLTITPYLLDRSAFDAYAFLINQGGKTLFYSGDLRNLNAKKTAFRHFQEVAPKRIDYMLLEQDALSSGSSAGAALPTEDEIEAEFSKVFRQNTGSALVYVSGQNIDRLMSIYKACQACRRILVMDLYFATVFNQLTNLATPDAPEFNGNYPNIKVWYPQKIAAAMQDRGYEHAPLSLSGDAHRFSVEDIAKNAAKVVMLVRPSMIADLENLDIFSENRFIANSVLIHSLWQGYQQRSETRGFVDTLQEHGLPTIKYIHTSGQADLVTIQKIIEAVQPRYLVPINVADAAKCGAIAGNVEILRLDALGEFTI